MQAMKAYGFDIFPERWKVFDGFLEMMTGREAICYCTNKEALILR